MNAFSLTQIEQL